ncbi:MAG: hypothetical protein ACM3N0_12730 [Chloroflexota bacterium]
MISAGTTARKPKSAHLPCAVAGIVAVALLLAFAAPASAARDPLAGGNTDMHMKRGFLVKLGNNAIGMRGLGSAVVEERKASMKVKGGKLDPTNAEGFVEQGGGIKLERGTRGVPITKIVVNTFKSAVYATVAKARMQIGALNETTSAREGFGANFKATKVTLTDKAARRISNRLGLSGGHRIEGGRVMSNVYSAVQPSTVTVLPQGSATLVGDLGTLKKFGEKGVALPEGISAISPATKPTPVSFQFPIVGGTLAPDAKAGVVQTSGGVQIAKETGATMALTDIYVDMSANTATVEIAITPSPPFPGPVGRSSIADLTLTGATVVADPVARTIEVKDAEAKLQAVAAATLNDVFNQPAPEPPPSSNFVVGDPLGKFSLKVQGQ